MRNLIQSYRTLPLLFVNGCIAGLAGCASLPPAGSPDNALAKAPIAADQINWPRQYEPANAGFFVHNEIHIAAPPEVVFNLIVQAESWPSWYEGAENVKLTNGTGGTLRAGSEFTWSTMGLDFTSTVIEFQPPFRLSWESRKSSIKGYHAWLIIPTGSGSRVVTEESQHGFMTVMQKIFVPDKLRKLHDVWLSQIKKKSEVPGLSLVALGGLQ